MIQTRVLYQPKHVKSGFYRYGWMFVSPTVEQAEHTKRAIRMVRGYRFRFGEVLPGDIDYQKQE